MKLSEKARCERVKKNTSSSQPIGYFRNGAHSCDGVSGVLSPGPATCPAGAKDARAPAPASAWYSRHAAIANRLA